MERKACAKCKEDLPVGMFNWLIRRKNATPTARRTECKTCQAAYSRLYHEQNKEVQAIRQKEYKIRNADAVRASKKIYAEATAEWNKAYQKIYYQEHKEQSIEYSRAWRSNNPEAYRKQTREYMAKRRKDIDFKLLSYLRDRCRRVLKDNVKAGSAVHDLGCTGAELRIHLQSLFEPGMSWDNYGNGRGKWSIDHIMPLDIFDLSDRQHFLLANHYLNLQPMWSCENSAKCNKPDKMLSYIQAA